MNLKQFNIVADNMLLSAKLSKTDITTLKSLAEDLEGEEKTAAEAKVTEAETKVSEEEDEEEAEDKELAEKGKKTFTLAEVKELLSPISKKLNEVVTEQRIAKIDSDLTGLMLSEKVPTGFKPAVKGKLVDFLKTLSDEQITAYMLAHKDAVAHVDFSESGSGDGNTINNPDAEAAAKELSEKAAVIVKEKGVNLGTAMKEVISANKELAEKAAKSKKC